jgi:hypothetical protein
MSILSVLKLKISKNHIRQVKNSFSDDLDLLKYQIDNIRGKIFNYPSSSKSTEEDRLYDSKTISSSKKTLKIVFAVTESGEKASAGDYFTALEFGECLKNFGWDIGFYSKKGHGYWYDIDEDVDVIISMLDIYDPRRIRCLNGSLIKIAWPRN